MKVRRSTLSTPGSDLDMLETAAGSGADEVMLDLEDAVSEDEKANARTTVIEAIERLDWEDTLVCVRVNGLATPHTYGDVTAVLERVGERVDSVMVPKVTQAKDVYAIDTLIGQVEANAGIQDEVNLQILIEETEALQNVDEIAAESERTESLVFGSGDYSASVGIDHPSARPDRNAFVGDRDVWYHARNEIVNAARSNGIQPIDGPYAGFEDTEGFYEEAERARANGFVGKWAIHPDQITIAHDVFSPDEDDIEYARAVLAALDEGEDEGAGAVNFDGIMLDVAHRRHATRTLERARELGLID